MEEKWGEEEMIDSVVEISESCLTDDEKKESSQGRSGLGKWNIVMIRFFFFFLEQFYHFLHVGF